VAGVAPLERPAARVEVGQEHRGRRGDVEPDGERLQPPHDLGGGEPLDDVRAGGVAELPHRRGGGQPVPGHVTDAQGDAAVGQGEHVVPVAADLDVAGGRQVVRRQLQAVELGQPLGEQAALQGARDLRLALQLPRALGERGQHLRDRAQQRGVLRVRGRTLHGEQAQLAAAAAEQRRDLRGRRGGRRPRPGQAKRSSSRPRRRAGPSRRASRRAARGPAR
jgi:hypothetical protein